MKGEKRRFGRALRWTWGLTVATVFHVALYWGVALTQNSGQKLRRQERQFTDIQYLDRGEAEQLINQQMTLFDPRPLMLPTQWNAANAAGLLGLGQEEADIFPEFPPMFELEDGNYIDDFGNVPANYDRLSVAQAEFGFPLFRELGRITQDVDFVEEPGLLLRLVDPGTGRELISASIYNEAVDAVSAKWPSWRPTLFLATVEDSFQVGGLSLVESSGFDEADRRLEGVATANLAALGVVGDGVYLVEMVP